MTLELRIVTSITNLRFLRERLVQNETGTRSLLAQALARSWEPVQNRSDIGPMSERFSLGARIRALRQLHSMSMQTLAGESGVSQSYLSDIESGKAANPSIATIQAISSAFGLTVSELLLENKAQLDEDDRLALLTDLYINELDEFGREAVLLIAKHHCRRTA